MFKKIFYFHSLSLCFWFSNMILSDAMLLPASQLQTQQVKTSVIRSRIEYLIQAFLLILGGRKILFFSNCRKNN